jgi:hypothetical protein
MKAFGKEDRVFRQDKLAAKVSSEGYCCLHGYLRLCRARGENPRNMAEFMGLHRYTLYYHLRALKKGERPCQKYSSCMLPIIEEIEKK